MVFHGVWFKKRLGFSARSGFFSKKRPPLSAATFGLCGVLLVWLGFGLAPLRVGVTRAVFLVSRKKFLVVGEYYQSHSEKLLLNLLNLCAT